MITPEYPANFDDIVADEYYQSLENGYDFFDYTIEDIALDMIAYSPAMEEFFDWGGEDFADERLKNRIIQALMKIVPSVNN